MTTAFIASAGRALWVASHSLIDVHKYPAEWLQQLSARSIGKHDNDATLHCASGFASNRGDVQLSFILIAILLAEAVSLVVAALIGFRNGLPAWLVILLALCFALSWRTLVVVASFGISRVFYPQAELQQLGRPMRASFVTFFTEALSSLSLFTVHQPLLSIARAVELLYKRATGMRRIRQRSGPVVILIHGFVCNAGMWGALRRKLRSVGFERVYAFNLDPFYRDMEKSVARFDKKLTRVLERCDAQQAILIGHSMGGVLVRMLRHQQPERVQAAVTLGAPHAGTELARWVSSVDFGPCRPDSRWLNAFTQSLQTEAHKSRESGTADKSRESGTADKSRESVTADKSRESGTADKSRESGTADKSRESGTADKSLAPLLNVYSDSDNIVYPQRSAALPENGLANAEQYELRGIGHLRLASDPQTLNLVAEFLKPMLSVGPKAAENCAANSTFSSPKETTL